MRSILDGTVREASLIQLVLAIATGLALVNLVQTIAFRIFVHPQAFMAVTPVRDWLGPPLLTFAICAVLLAIAMYLRTPSAGPFDGSFEDDEVLEPHE
jgi:hypothetical protein